MTQEAIAKAKAELAAAEAERAAALAEKEAALKALKKSPELPKIELPKISVPSISLPKLSTPSVSAPTVSAKAPKLDTANPAVQGLIAGAAVGALPAIAIISLRAFLASVRRGDAHSPIELCTWRLTHAALRVCIGRVGVALRRPVVRHAWRWCGSMLCGRHSARRHARPWVGGIRMKRDAAGPWTMSCAPRT